MKQRENHLGSLFRSTVIAAALAAAPLAAIQAQGVAQEFNVQSQSLSQSLLALSRQSGKVITLPNNIGDGLVAPAVQGSMLLTDALELVLEGTGLEFEQSSDNSFVIKEKSHKAEATDSIPSSKEKTAYINEVIVTAEKREQNLQDVPVAISAFSAEMIEARGISSPEDLQFSVPSLTIGETTGGQAQVTIRGVGTENGAPGGDPGVPLHIDGHYIQAPAYMLRNMLDVERVEVLRGPQGLLYGRNAVGGNINIITKRPTEEVEGLLSADIGNYDKVLVQGALSGPLSDRLRGRIAAAREQRKGFVTNVTNGDDDLDNSDYWTMRGAMEFDLTDSVEIYFGGYYYNDRGNPFPTRITTEYPRIGIYAALPAGYTNPTFSGPQKVQNNTPVEGRDKATGTFLDIDWDLGATTFRSLTAYNDTDRRLLTDLDSTDILISQQDSTIGYETVSQEFQLLSKQDDNLNWIVGLFYYEEDSAWDFRIFDMSGLSFDTPANHTSKSYAAFGQIDYSLTDAWEFVAGLRYNRDEKKIDRSISFTLDGGSTFIIPRIESTFKDSWSEPTWKFGVNYHANNDVMFYTAYSRGYKSGGFNATALEEIGYKPETLDAYEAGIKSRWLNNRLQLNLAAFYYDYTNKQEFKVLANAAGAATASLTNAGAATVKGVELETVVVLTDGLTVDGALSWQDAKYDEFISQDPTRAALGNLDLSGNNLTRTPEWKYCLGVQYEWLLGRNLGSIKARTDYTWEDQVFFRAFNQNIDKRDSYHRTNFRLTWESVGAEWMVETYVFNVEDDQVQSNEIIFAEVFGFSQAGNYFSPRTYGIKATYKF